jgi:hypothetical protein
VNVAAAMRTAIERKATAENAEIAENMILCMLCGLRGCLSFFVISGRRPV